MLRNRELRENTKKLKKLVALVIFLIMLLIIIFYAVGLDKYVHPTPKAAPQVSAWGESENNEDFEEPTEEE